MKQKKTNRIISLILVVVLFINMNLTAFAESNVNSIICSFSGQVDSIEYVIQTEQFDIQAGRSEISGDISEVSELVNLHDGLLAMISETAQIVENNYVGGDVIENETSLYSGDGYSIGAGLIELTNTIVAENSITLNGSTIHGEGVLYSRNQDIVINANSVDFSGILYAPNGTVYLSGTNFKLEGSIIAKRVVVRAGSFTISQSNTISAAIASLEYIRMDQIIGLSAYYSEENDEIVLQWSEDEEITSVDVYARYIDGCFEQIAVTTDDEYKMSSAALSDQTDYRVIAHTKFGETVCSTILTLVKDEEGIYETVIDSDDDGIPDGYECIIGTDPYNADTDRDGFSDGYELMVLYTNPLTCDDDADFDGDGLTNLQEMELGISPYLADSDFDGIIDSEDSLPMKSDVKSNREVCYDIPVQSGYFDLVTRYIDNEGNQCEFVYNYLNGQIKYLSASDDKSYNIYDQDNQLTAAIEYIDGKVLINTYTYSNGNIETITNSGTQYNFFYTDNGDLTKVMVGSRTLIEYGYSEEQLISEIYGNGAESEYIYDEEGCIIAQKTNGAVAYEWTYDKEGKVISFNDLLNGIVYTYGYDEDGNATAVCASNGFEISYDDADDIYAVKYVTDTDVKEQTTAYFEEEDTEGYVETRATTNLISSGKLISVTTSEGTTEKTIYSNDKLITSAKYYSSEDGVTKIEYQDGRVLEYIYDEDGNIASVQENGEEKASYSYDGLGQLVRENSFDANKTVVYTYDNSGNLLRADEYEYTVGALEAVRSTKTYKYEDTEWGDLLTDFNGQKITYDEIGNPLSYRDGIQFAWNGRQLVSMQREDDTVLYTYDSNGIRTAKTVNGVETIYYLEGTKIVAETTNNNTKWYIYDEDDSIIGFEWEERTYYFEKNAQGDVVRIVDADGNSVCEYHYDAWGNISSVSGDEEIAAANPFRYRGYYYDEESGFYYLQSRYYDSYTGRFLNADDVTYLGISGYNLFAYCCNNVPNLTDINGHAPEYINSQGDNVIIDGKKMKDISLGLGNIAANGCGVIAAYNVLLSKSSKVKFNDVKNGIIWIGALNAGGLLGIKPNGLELYMRTKFWSVIAAGPITYLWGIKAELSSAVIVLIKWKGTLGMHYIAGIGTGHGGVGGSFRFYNTGLVDKNGKPIDKKEMSIWDFLNCVKQQGATPIYFIGVSGKLGWW